MYRQLTDQAERYLRSLYQQDDIAGELKRKLADLMARGEANADAACRALKLSRRTLQRRLDARLKSLEIAMLLGYSNISTFTTAFKSWYNMPPAEYRQKFLGAS
jgi:AraC-like DNA-binding protein